MDIDLVQNMGQSVLCIIIVTCIDFIWNKVGWKTGQSSE